jgi:excisionase family DNA binding protein
MANIKRKSTDAANATQALFVRIPAEHARRLDRAAFELRRPKRALVSELVERYIDPDSPASLAALAGAAAAAPGRPLERVDARAEAGRRRVTVETLEPDALVVGHHSFRGGEQSAPSLEVLRSEQAAELLQVTCAVLERLAERGELPGRKLAGEWRFSRAALLEWLAGPAPARADGEEDGER